MSVKVNTVFTVFIMWQKREVSGVTSASKLSTKHK